MGTTDKRFREFCWKGREENGVPDGRHLRSRKSGVFKEGIDKKKNLYNDRIIQNRGENLYVRD